MKQFTGGVLHSKFWVVDGRHIYVGSANMDWRSLTQVSPSTHGQEAHLEFLPVPLPRALSDVSIDQGKSESQEVSRWNPGSKSHAITSL